MGKILQIAKRELNFKIEELGVLGIGMLISIF
jgi:hypothetical protein